MKRLFLLLLFSKCLFAYDALLYTSNGKFLIEIADTDSKRAHGFMHRFWIPKFTGILFIFPDAKELTFWMKNTLNPLNIYFYDDYGSLIRAHRAEPCKTKNCPLYSSVGKSKFVLEIHASSRFISPYKLYGLRLLNK